MAKPSTLNSAVPSKPTRYNSVEITLTITLNPSGMAHLNGLPFHDDEQLLANIKTVIAEKRKEL